MTGNPFGPTPLTPPTPLGDEVASAPAPSDTTTPTQGPVAWVASRAFRAYFGSWLLMLTGWLTENLSTHAFAFKTWTWISFTVSTLAICAAVVRDWMSPTVVAPFAALNKNNTTPPSSGGGS